MPDVTLDVSAFAIVDGELAVLLRRARAGLELPWAAFDGGALDAAAARLAREAAGRVGWLSLAGVFDAADAHPSGADLSLAFAALVPADALDAAGDEHEWHPVGDRRGLSDRHRRIVDAALALVRDRLDRAPVAFRLLPPEFTLADLQHAWELLLGRPLHKASFRRSLDAAALVEPTGEWRAEGRGRPAQLYRMSKRKRRPPEHGARFDF